MTGRAVSKSCRPTRLLPEHAECLELIACNWNYQLDLSLTRIHVTRVDVLRKSHVDVVRLTQKPLLHLRLRWRSFLNSISLKQKNSALLCYSFVQFVVVLFDVLNDDAEYHYI